MGNLAAEDDLVAAHLDLKPYFPPTPRSTVTPHTHIIDTGSKPHDITHYLTKPTGGAHHHRNACRTVELTKGLGLTTQADTSELNTSQHSLDFTFTERNVSHPPTDGI